MNLIFAALKSFNNLMGYTLFDSRPFGYLTGKLFLRKCGIDKERCSHTKVIFYFYLLSAELSLVLRIISKMFR